ncbi:Propionyl-CoA carboxylase beta chain, mitochondrial [Porphyridium purpureum]|uniref:Propionyl-CoA carboxylase beta chain, mitochondrial n=1 Tax=Porphyridium purpureum TaxID=35688 RepID=A0A5J4Z1S9_PORPP|nr:Propionyl-CoA carboxylase beta chain, mitochondrial [Porphyridium purpureum]|eukprot:POR3990..scf208_2
MAGRLLSKHVRLRLAPSAPVCLAMHSSRTLCVQVRADTTATRNAVAETAAADLAEEELRGGNILRLRTRRRIERENADALLGGGAQRLEKHHASGRLSARERLLLLLDQDTFHEMDRLKESRNNNGHSRSAAKQKKNGMGDGVVTGRGLIDGRTVFVYSQDFTVQGGSLGEAHAEKICKVMDLAAHAKAPVIGISDSGGARISESVAALSAYSSIFKRIVKMSGYVPQISVVMGPAAGGAVYAPALTDFVFMVRETSHMFLTGPDVVEQVTREKVSFESLGGADVHASKSGVAHYVGTDDIDVLRRVRELCSFLPSHAFDVSPPTTDHITCEDDIARRDESLDWVVPDDSKEPYDMRYIIERVVDGGHFFEIHRSHAQNLLVGFARLGGRSVGIVANQPTHMAGVLDINASMKGARFVRFCDAFNVPLVTFVDVPGFLPGTGQEHNGIIRHGAKLLFAFADATVPKINVITRKAFGGAYCVLASKEFFDYNYAWPTAEIAVMGAAGAVRILNHKEISAAASPEDAKALLQRLENEYAEEFVNPLIAAHRGYVDAIIQPADTRRLIIHDLECAGDASTRESVWPRKHDNLPI